MAKPGPKTKSNNLKVINGVENKARLNPDEPQVDTTMPTCPEWVKGYAIAVWKRLAPKLHKSGILTNIDRDTFAMYCTLVSAFRDAVRDGDVNRQIKMTQQVRIMAAEFGLTPSSRSGLHVSPGKGKSKDDKKKAARLLGGGGRA